MRTPVVLLQGEGSRTGHSVALERAQARTQEGVQAVIVEGGPGNLVAPAGVELVQLAAGCPCCAGQLPLRVTIARLLRLVKPVRLWIEVSAGTHLPTLRKQLGGPGFVGAVMLVDEAENY